MKIILLIASQLINLNSLANEKPQNQIFATLTDLKSDKGVVRCAIWNSGEGFPVKNSTAIQAVSAPIRDGKAVCVFNLPPDIYAISAFHDENENGKLDTNWLGIPTEGVAASNNAKGSFGPPRFRDASFEYKGGILNLQMKVMYI